MAKEITVNAGLNASKGGMSVGASVVVSITMESTLDTLHHTLQDVTDTPTPISMGSINTSKDVMVMLINRGAATVLISDDTSSVFFMMLPGESWGPIRLYSTAVMYWRLSAEPGSQVEVVAIEAGDPTV